MLRRPSRLMAVSLAHFSIDVFNSMGPIVLAFISAYIVPLSKTQIGLAASLYSVLHGLSQPVFGWLADKSGGRTLGAGGLLWTPAMLIIAFIAFSTSGEYLLLLIPYTIAPLGSAAFHPIGTMHASTAVASESARSLPKFFLAGYLGAAVGPILTGFLLDSSLSHNDRWAAALGPAFDLPWIEQASVLPLALVLLLLIPAFIGMIALLPGKAQHRELVASTRREGAASGPIYWRPLLLLAVIILLRSLTHPGAVPFLPLLFQEKGWSATEFGAITSLFWIAGALLGISAGRMAERYDRRVIISVLIVLGSPMFWLLPRVDGAAALLVALLAGGLTGAPHSLLVAEIQRLLPGRRGLASGAALGFIFAAGSLGNLIMGALSDAWSISAAFETVAILGLVSGVLAWVLPWHVTPQQAREHSTSEAVAAPALPSLPQR
jgi:FSR family fosmidomycin resistance protein-like MFS transporter